MKIYFLFGIITLVKCDGLYILNNEKKGVNNENKTNINWYVLTYGELFI